MVHFATKVLTLRTNNLHIGIRKYKRKNKYVFPIFSYDARLGGPENGKRWSDEDRGFGKRAYLEVQKDTINQISSDTPNKILSYLHIQDIHAKEAGLYKCRVDFKTAPTKNYYMNLSVIGKLFVHMI